MSEDRLILEGIVRRLEAELGGLHFDAAGYWEAGDGDAPGDDGLVRAAPLPPEIAEAGRLGHIHLLDALDTARAALRASDEESLAWAARWCQAIALAGREMQGNDRERRIAELGEEKATRDRAAAEGLRERRLKGGRTTGQKRHDEQAARFAPYRVQFEALVRDGIREPVARAKIGKRIANEHPDWPRYTPRTLLKWLAARKSEGS